MPLKLTGDLFVTQSRYGNIEEGTADAWIVIACPFCSGTQAVKIAYTLADYEPPQVLWARCVNCKCGFVINNGAISPAPMPLTAIRGLDPETEVAWQEIRSCLGAGANTAAVHMCRKVLLHIAVEEGLPESDDRGWAPSFAACIDYLVERGDVTPRMKPWVDKIRNVGNEGAHELKQIPADKALLVARFTMQLLVVMYEIKADLEEADTCVEPDPAKDE